MLPDLGKTVCSLLLHLKNPSHGLHSTSNQSLFITFPNFVTKAIIGDNDIYLNAVPVCATPLNQCPNDLPLPLDSTPPYTGVRQLQHEIGQQETRTLDNLLVNPWNYYKTIKTKRQLKMEVPAGFCSLMQAQRQFTHGLLERKMDTLLECSDSSISDAYLNHLSSDDETIITLNTSPHNDINPSSSYTPIIHSVEKPSSSLPSVMTLSEDFIRSSVGFRKIDTMKRHFSSLYQNSVKLDTTPADAVLDPGSFATMKKKSHSTTPVARPSSFADVIHMDVIFSPEISIGNIHYGLLFTDQYSRMTYLYSLHNLTSDIPKQLQI